MMHVIFYFQVSATALEETKVLVWHRDKLKLTLMETPYLFTVFEHIIARDVVRKLAQVSFQFLDFYGQKKQLNIEFFRNLTRRILIRKEAEVTQYRG